jgi:hypothetical protein
MFLPIAEHLRRIAYIVLSYSDIVKNRLLNFVKEVKSGKFKPEQIANRAMSIDDNIKHFLKLQEQELSKDGNRSIPSNLVPKHMHGNVNINDVIKEVHQLYNSFQQQAKNPGQHKFLPDTVKKLIECFDGISGTLKAKTSTEGDHMGSDPYTKNQEHHLLLEQQRSKRDRESLTSLSRLVDELNLELGDQKDAKPARIILDMKKEIKKLTGI